MDNIAGKMEENIKEIIKMIKNKDLESIIGQIKNIMKVNGVMESNMGKES